MNIWEIGATSIPVILQKNVILLNKIRLKGTRILFTNKTKNDRFLRLQFKFKQSLICSLRTMYFHRPHNWQKTVLCRFFSFKEKSRCESKCIKLYFIRILISFETPGLFIAPALYPIQLCAEHTDIFFYLPNLGPFFLFFIPQQSTYLNRCVLSRMYPHTTDPTIPATMMTSPILPASSSLPWNKSVFLEIHQRIITDRCGDKGSKRINNNRDTTELNFTKGRWRDPKQSYRH